MIHTAISLGTTQWAEEVDDSEYARGATDEQGDDHVR
jgi:hypothetical protein